MRHLTEKKYQERIDDGSMKITKYLSIQPHQREGSGWGGYNKNMRGRKFKVFQRGDRFFSTWKAQHNGEVYIRFPHTFMSWNSFSGTSTRKRYIVAHYPIINGKRVEELVYFSPTVAVQRAISFLFRDCGIEPTNAKEFVFLIYRDDWSIGRYNVQIYFHDTDLPDFEEGHCSRDKIIQERTGVETEWLVESPIVHCEQYDNNIDDKIVSVIEMMKRKVIPFNTHIPTKDEYFAWFKYYLDADNDIAEELFNNRYYFRLP